MDNDSRRPEQNEEALFTPEKVNNFSLLATSNSKTLNSDQKTPKSVKRIFPGPAGLMCDTTTSDCFSQTTASIFQESPWISVTQEFSNLLERFNIDWIKKQTFLSDFTIQKVPFLAAFLLSLEVAEQGQGQKSVNITLKDPTGSIKGNVLHSLYQEYEAHFKVGAILLLRQAPVLSCACDKCDNHHLTITHKSLSQIYNGNEKIVLKSINPECIISEYLTMKKTHQHEKKINLKKFNQGSSLNRNTPSNETCLSLPKVMRFSEVRTKKCESDVKTRKLFSFKKTTSKENCNLENSLKKLEQSNQEESVAIPDCQFSIRTDSEEHAEIWKEVLNGVDLSSLFDGEF